MSDTSTLKQRILHCKHTTGIAVVVFLLSVGSMNLFSDSLPVVISDTIHTGTTGMEIMEDSPAATIAPDRDAKTSLPGGVLFGSFTKEDTPVLISGNVIIPSGQTVEFGPACTVFVGGVNTSITVFGRIVAHGTPDEPVVFMSSKKDPAPWDWDRIYCRSNNHSLFDHCHIRNANYGIIVENGSVEIRNCRFENNSLYGLSVKNGYATVVTSTFTKGHSLAIALFAGSEISADSLFIYDNISGVYCAEKSRFRLTGGCIKNNSNGMIVAQESSVEIVGADISNNTNGVITETVIASSDKETVFSNGVNVKKVSSNEIKLLVKEPLPLVSVMIPSKKTKPELPGEFKPGFSALHEPAQPLTGFIGNVTTGLTFYDPRSEPHPVDFDTVESYKKRSNGSIDTVISRNKIIRRQTRYPGEQSDTWYAGIQPELTFFANGRRGNTDVNLFMDLYSNQWLSTADYLGKNVFNLTMNYTDHQVVIGDFTESGSETSITGRQLTGIKYTGKKIDMGRGEKRFEFKLAAGETEIAKDSGDHELFVYNQVVDTGMSKRQQITYITEAIFRPTFNSSIGAKGIIARDQYNKPLLRKTLNDPAVPNPIEAQTGCFTGNIFLLDRKVEVYGEIDLGSADTLSDSAASDIAWYNPEIEKSFPEVLSLFNPSDFTDHYAGSIGSRGTFGNYNANIRYLHIAPSYFSAGDPYLVTWRKNMLASVVKTIPNRGELSVSYEFDRSVMAGVYEENTPQITDINTGSINSSWTLKDGLPTFTIDYTLQQKKNDSRESFSRNDTTYSAGFDEKELCTILSVEGKQSFSNGMSYSLQYQFLHDNDYSDHPNHQLQDVGNRFHNAVSGWYSMKYKRFLRNRIRMRYATKNEHRDSLRAWQYRVSDLLSFQILPGKLNINTEGEYSCKSEKEYGEDSWESDRITVYYSGMIELKYSITIKLSSTVMAKYEKSFDEIYGSGENYTARIAGFHLTYLF